MYGEESSVGALKPPPTSNVRWLLNPPLPPPGRDRLSNWPPPDPTAEGAAGNAASPRWATSTASSVFELDSVEEAELELEYAAESSAAETAWALAEPSAKARPQAMAARPM